MEAPNISKSQTILREKNNAGGIISDSNYSNYNKFIVPKTKWLVQKQTFWATEWNRGHRNKSTHLEACNFGNIWNIHQRKKTTNNFEETRYPYLEELTSLLWSIKNWSKALMQALKLWNCKKET